jgi:hypothetical protein
MLYVATPDARGINRWQPRSGGGNTPTKRQKTASSSPRRRSKTPKKASTPKKAKSPKKASTPKKPKKPSNFWKVELELFLSHEDNKTIQNPEKLMSKTARIKQIIRTSIDHYVDIRNIVIHKGPKRTTATVTGKPTVSFTDTFVEEITNNYGDSAADGWMEGDIYVSGGRTDNYKGDPVELHLRLVKVVKM